MLYYSLRNTFQHMSLFKQKKIVLGLKVDLFRGNISSNTKFWKIWLILKINTIGKNLQKCVPLNVSKHEITEHELEMCFNPLQGISFRNQWKHQKARGFLIQENIAHGKCYKGLNHLNFDWNLNTWNLFMYESYSYTLKK